MAVQIAQLPGPKNLRTRREDGHRLLPGVQELAQDAVLGVQGDPLDPVTLHHGMLDAPHLHRVRVTTPLDNWKMLLITPLLGALNLKKNHRLTTTDKLPHTGVKNLHNVAADLTLPDLISLSHNNQLKKANRAI
jgi:hypothetical protein